MESIVRLVSLLWPILDLKYFLINISLEKLLPHVATHTRIGKKNLHVWREVIHSNFNISKFVHLSKVIFLAFKWCRNRPISVMILSSENSVHVSVRFGTREYISSSVAYRKVWLETTKTKIICYSTSDQVIKRSRYSNVALSVSVGDVGPSLQTRQAMFRVPPSLNRNVHHCTVGMHNTSIFPLHYSTFSHSFWRNILSLWNFAKDFSNVIAKVYKYFSVKFPLLRFNTRKRENVKAYTADMSVDATPLVSVLQHMPEK